MKTVHVVSFDIPWPADYGGVIDIYHKLEGLKNAGVKVILHTFTYHRKPAPELDLLCEKVFYYQRKTSTPSHITLSPYIVKSRKDKALLQNLQADDHPIIFEGLHCCGFIDHPSLKQKKKIYRESNIEHEYYKGLSKAARSLKEKLFFRLEAARLKHFQKKLRFADLILPVSLSDTRYFQEQFPGKEVIWIPSFHGHSEAEIATGRGNFVLFQGNLSVQENSEAARWLIKNVFSKIPVKSVIAGKNPDAKLVKEADKHPLVEVIPDPSKEEMDKLIRDAQAHVLVTLRPAGLKLKLVNALYNGRHCIANHHMLKGTNLDEACIKANTGMQIRNAITDVMQTIWTAEDTAYRNKLIEPYHDNHKIAALVALLN